MLLITALAIWFGVRPITRALLQPPLAAAEGPILTAVNAPAALAAPEPARPELPPPERPNLLPGLAASPLRQVQQRLEQLVEHDEERAAAILKQWLQESEGA